MIDSGKDGRGMEPLKRSIARAIQLQIHRSREALICNFKNDLGDRRGAIEFLSEAQKSTWRLSNQREASTEEAARLINRTVAIASSPSGALVLVKDARKFIAYLLVSNDHRRLLVLDIYISPLFRRRGVAAWLLATCNLACRVAGLGEMLLYVAQRNRPALKLYASLGFRRAGFSWQRGQLWTQMVLPASLHLPLTSIDSKRNLCFYVARLMEEGVMAETEAKRKAREALERAKAEADKALEKLKGGTITNDQEIERMSKSARQFFDVNISC